MSRQKLKLMYAENPANIVEEAQMLLEMGLEEYEVNYVLHLKQKERARNKWVR